jgi:membrane peptidoglycan carboxypeptidase
LKNFNEPEITLPQKKNWYPGDVVNLSIGQGDLEVTPLQVARMIAAFVEKGKAKNFRLLEQIQDSAEKNVLVKFAEPLPFTKQELNKQHQTVVAQGMFLVVNGTRGTAKAATHPYMDIAGKTGTAQWNGAYVGWFSGFLPYANPRYAFAVMIEGEKNQGLSGGGDAAPIAGEFFKKVFPNGFTETDKKDEEDPTIMKAIPLSKNAENNADAPKETKVEMPSESPHDLISRAMLSHNDEEISPQPKKVEVPSAARNREAEAGPAQRWSGNLYRGKGFMQQIRDLLR